MRIWQKPISIEELTRSHVGTVGGHIGLEFVEIGDDYIVGRVPVDARTIQPYGILHGGVNVVLAETLGSVAAACSIPDGWRSVGLNVSANHVRAARQGWVTGTARPVHLGQTTHVWAIELHDETGRLTCTCSLTMALLPPTHAQNVKLAAQPPVAAQP